VDPEDFRMNRTDLIARARLGFEKAGRGVVVKLVEDAEPRYAPVEEVKARLVEEKADPDILFGVLYGCDKYDTKWQTVLLLELEECCTVSIVSYNRSETVASVTFAPAN
jgi:hypothetical protein